MARIRTLGLMLVAVCLVAPAVAAEGIAWRDDFEAARREAASTGRLVLLHFSGTFCPPCRAMEQTVFNRADVAQAVEQNYVPVAVDVEKNPGLKQQFGIRPIPADVIVTPEGQVINKSIGAKSPQDYVATLSHYARLARKTGGDRHAGWQPGTSGPGGVGQPPMNQPPTNQRPTNQQQAALPSGAHSNARGADWPSQTGVQPNGLAPRVGQQYPHETMLQPPPAPNARNAGGPDAGSTPFGPPTSRGTGSAAAAWRQQELPVQAGPGARGTAPRGPNENPQVTPPWGALAPAPGATPAAPSTPPAWPPSDWPTGSPPGAAPPNSPPPPQPGFGGYCAVTMYHEGRWAAGDRRWGVIHEGRLYLFASEQAKEAFRREFNRYAPVFGGDDIVIFVESGQRVPGQVRIGAKQGEQDPRTYLFANEQSYQKFYWNPAFYIERLRQITSGAGGR